jgi:hypothetical protein
VGQQNEGIAERMGYESDEAVMEPVMYTNCMLLEDKADHHGESDQSE